MNREFNEERKRHYRENSNIPAEYWQYKWKDYKFDINFSKTSIVNSAVVQSRKAAWEKSIEYAKNIVENHNRGRSLFYTGRGSSGKTVLATLILREAIEKMMVSVLHVPFSRLVVDFHTMYKREEISDSIESYLDPHFLCIDEVDVDRNMADKFKNIFDHILTSRRYEKKPTIITSKVGIDKIGDVCGDAIRRLIEDSGVYEIINIYSEGEDPMRIFDSNIEFDIDLLVKELSLSGRNVDKTITGKALRQIIENCVKRG